MTTSNSCPVPKRTKKSNSSPERDENGDFILRIPTFAQVKPLLEKTGYSFREGVYCRPKGDPMIYPNAVEGDDYFASESSFRDFLCRIGVDCNGSGLTWDDKEHVVSPWIRYSVVKSRKDENTLPALDLTHFDPRALLDNLDFGCIHAYRHESNVYMLPGVTKKEARRGVNTFPEKPELWVYLARHGLPDNCQFEKITSSDRLALEQFIATAIDSEDLDL